MVLLKGCVSTLKFLKVYSGDSNRQPQPSLENLEWRERHKEREIERGRDREIPAKLTNWLLGIGLETEGGSGVGSHLVGDKHRHVILLHGNIE